MQPESAPPSRLSLEQASRHVQGLDRKMAEMTAGPRRLTAEVAAQTARFADRFKLEATPDFLGPLRAQQEEIRRQVVQPMQERLAVLAKVAEAAEPRRYTPTLPPVRVNTAELRIARHTQELAAVATEQQDLLRELRDQLAKSEERRAQAEQATAEAEAKRHSAIMRATWGAAIVGAVVGVLLTVVLTLLLLG